MNHLFYSYLEDVRNKDKNSFIYKIFLNSQCDDYLENTNDKRKVIDFISGMTDEFFLAEVKRYNSLEKI